jgi:hypothetical protein
MMQRKVLVSHLFGYDRVMHTPHNAEGHFPGLGESLESPRAPHVLCREMLPIAGRLRGVAGGGCGCNHGSLTGLIRPAVGS